VARYDVRAGAFVDDATRSDLARETKQALAYAAISSALSAPRAGGERNFELLGAAMESALDSLLSLVGCSYRGIDPFSFEPMFVVQGSERELPFDALPTRARHLAAFAALSVRTLWAAYPDRDPRESEGVIAIDEADLHQDSQVQQQILRAFREALPGAQWILTTASPILASSADARAVLALRQLPKRFGEGEAVRVFAGDQARTH
jgi:predicted ATP-binding protein involved in virulence